MNIKTDILMPMLLSVVLSVLLGKIIIKQLKKSHIGQEIRDDGPKSHMTKAGTPTMGGIIFVITTIVVLLIYRKFDREIFVVCFGMLGFGAIGFVDDFMKLVMKRSLGLNEKQKLILQFIVSVIGIFLASKVSYSPIQYQRIPFVDHLIDFKWIAYPMFIFVLMGAANATNLTDGLDGLCTSVSIPVFLGMMFISSTMRSELTVFNAIFIGSLIGFLVYNANPASVFMGDTGSMAIGGALSMMCILYNMSIYLVIIGGIYVVEVLSVIIQMLSYRYRNKKRIFLMSPLHHHYELKGYQEQKIVAVFAIISVLLSMITILLFI